MRLSLLRSSKAPDGHADMGRHIIRYALLPHRTQPCWRNLLIGGGSLAEAAVVRAGYNFNNPMRVGHVSTSSAAGKIREIMGSIQFSGSPNVVLDTVKRGEDDDDVTSTPIKKRDSRNIVLRIYEAYGGKGSAKVMTYNTPFGVCLIDRYLPVKKAFQTNILEDDGDEIDVLVCQKGGNKIATVEVSIRPFEVVTLRLEM
jgi:alpha-mannosidase